MITESVMGIILVNQEVEKPKSDVKKIFGQAFPS